MKKKSIVIFLVFVFVFNAWGFFAIFKIQQYKIKKEVKALMKKNIPEDQLTIFCFQHGSSAIKNLEWLNAHEFRYNGQMFDVVKIKREKNQTVYYCINDTQENILFANLDEYISNHSSSRNNEQTQLFLKIFFQVFHVPEQFFLSVFRTDKELWNCFLFFFYSSPLSVLSPPPKQ